MSVRLCYISRAGRGSVLRSARLVGQGVDESWTSRAPVVPTPEDATADIETAAGWIAERLSQSRSAGALELLCLDADGSVFSWLSSPTHDPAAVAALARMGPATDDSMASASSSPIMHFAGDAIDSTIQPLSRVDAPEATALLDRVRKKGPAPIEPSRLAVLGAIDAPVRLLVDALDSRDVEVASVASIWHAAALAWDPGAGRRLLSPADPALEQAAASTAVVLVDASPTSPRLLWCWSREGSLLAAGCLRLPTHKPALSAADAARLAGEWLSWSLQLGEAPRRVVCVLQRDSGDAAAFAAALAEKWDGSTVDVALHDDPVGVTLERLAKQLEGSPPEPAAASNPARALVDLSSRPGRPHRTLYLWSTIVVAAAAIVTGVIAGQVRASVSKVNDAAQAWRATWEGKLKQALPQAFGGILPPDQRLKDEIAKLDREMNLPSGVESAKPVLEEIETISMVLSSADYSLDKLDLSSGDVVRLTVQVPTIAAAEELERALSAISGSHVSRWQSDFQRREIAGKTVIEARFTGTWAETKRNTPGAGAKP